MIDTDKRIEIFERLSDRFSLIPVEGKAPFEKDWTQWCDEKRKFKREDFTGKNAGITCGRASGILVLDVDEPDLFQLECIKNHWTLPETFTVKTGGGGEHYYYEYPDDGSEYRNKSYSVKNPDDGSKVHIFDFRGNGGQVVAPGSIHPETGIHYEKMNDLPIAPAVQWMLDFCREEPFVENLHTVPVESDNGKLNIPKDITELINNGVPKGKRSETQWHSLIRLISEGFSDNTIFDIWDTKAIGAKYREKGNSKRRWLQSEIDKARKYVDKHRKDTVKPLTQQKTDKSISVLETLPDAPVSDIINIPCEYEITGSKGVAKVKITAKADGSIERESKQISTSPLLITGRLENIDSGKENIRLSYFRDKTWKHHIAERKTISTTRLITELADFGISVSSVNNRNLVEYLMKFESENIDTIPRARMTNHLGWQKGSNSFLWGNTLFSIVDDNVVEIETVELSAQKWNREVIIFEGNDEGDTQIAKAFYREGTYDGWIEAINSISHFPKVMSSVYISLISPFLDVLKAENFSVDYANSTSTGKTTTLRISSSSWGNPNEKSRSSVLHSWGATYVWIENCAANLNGIPLFLDDTKLAGTGIKRDSAASKISNVLYAIANGRGRERGTIKGTRKTGAWRTVLLSSGEQSAVDFTEDGGTRGRIISFWGSLFNDTEKNHAEISQLVKQVNITVQENFGHAAPKIIRFILDNKSDWNKWRDMYKQYREYYSREAGTNEIATRLCDYVATIATVVPLIHAALPELDRDNVRATIDEIWQTVQRTSNEADRPTEALQKLYNWAASNQSRFHGRNEDYSNSSNACAGKWNRDSHMTEQWKEMAFSTNLVKDLLDRWSFDAKAVIKVWRDRGWLNTGSKETAKLVSVNNVKMRCYCVSRETIENVLGIKE